ncbi:MAG: hypothetical protein ABL997_12495 [Planctomycetota bacterium]
MTSTGLLVEVQRAQQPKDIAMGLINWIFDFYQHSKINDAQRDADNLRSEMQHLRSTRGDLDQERLLRAIGELALAVKTLQRATVEKGLFSEQDLRRIAQQVDQEDGRMDGKSPI